MSWLSMTEQEIQADPDALRERQCAYIDAFYTTQTGQEVMCDIHEMCYTMGDSDSDSIALIALYNLIRERAGGRTVTAELAMIEAEANAIVIEQPAEDEVEPTDKLGVN